MSRRVTILGATGSVGTSAASVIAASPDLSVEAVTAQSNAQALAETAVKLGASYAAVADPAAYPALKDALSGTGVAAAGGLHALAEAAQRPVDMVLSAIVGSAGVAPTAAGVRAGNAIALANKECLVCAGGAFMGLAEKAGVAVLPVDSEHNALHQILVGKDLEEVATLTLTASGGPFRELPLADMERVTPEQALRHPTWCMGPKISIDSATMMNKGLELIEAHYLFGVGTDRLRVLVHPQSVVHGIVTFRDGSLHAELGTADMGRPIAYCLNWPTRCQTPADPLDLAQLGTLTFVEPDLGRFPALSIAQNALAQGGGAPTVINAANEVAVNAFLRKWVAFTAIVEIVEETWQRTDKLGHMCEPGSVEEALALDELSRKIAAEAVKLRHPAAG